MPELMITANIHRVYISAPGTVLSSSHHSHLTRILSLWMDTVTSSKEKQKKLRSRGAKEPSWYDAARKWKNGTWTHLSLAPEPLFLTTMQNIFPPCSLYLLCKLCCINITDYNRENVYTLICVVTLYCTQTVYCFFCPNEWKLIS